MNVGLTGGYRTNTPGLARLSSRAASSPRAVEIVRTSGAPMAFDGIAIEGHPGKARLPTGWKERPRPSALARTRPTSSRRPAWSPKNRNQEERRIGPQGVDPIETSSSANRAIGQSISAWPTKSVTTVTESLRVVHPPRPGRDIVSCRDLERGFIIAI